MAKESNILWFTESLLKANPERSHLTNTTQEVQVSIGGMAILISKCEKRLGIQIDDKLKFESYVRSLLKKANQKLNTFANISYSFKSEQRKFLPNTLNISNFLCSSLNVLQPKIK